MRLDVFIEILDKNNTILARGEIFRNDQPVLMETLEEGLGKTARMKFYLDGEIEKVDEAAVISGRLIYDKNIPAYVMPNEKEGVFFRF